jgi:hypothetical protein
MRPLPGQAEGEAPQGAPATQRRRAQDLSLASGARRRAQAPKARAARRSRAEIGTAGARSEPEANEVDEGKRGSGHYGLPQLADRPIQRLVDGPLPARDRVGIGAGRKQDPA